MQSNRQGHLPPVADHREDRGGLAGLEAEDRDADREDLDRDQVEQEVRHGVGGEGDGGGGLVPEGVPPDRLVDPERDRDQDGDQEAHAGQVQAARPSLAEQRRHCLVQLVGVSEVAVQQGVHVVPVLHDDRIAVAVLGVPLRDRLRGGLRPEDHDGGRGEDRVQQDEDEDRDADQDHEGRPGPPDQVSGHRHPPPVPFPLPGCALPTVSQGRPPGHVSMAERIRGRSR